MSWSDQMGKPLDSGHITVPELESAEKHIIWYVESNISGRTRLIKTTRVMLQCTVVEVKVCRDGLVRSARRKTKSGFLVWIHY